MATLIPSQTIQARGAELEAISNVIEQGVRKGDVKILKETFHKESHMFSYKRADLFITPIDGLYQYIITLFTFRFKIKVLILNYFQLLFLLSSLMSGIPLMAQEITKHDEKEIISWIREQAMPIQNIDPNSNTADLEPLKQILKGVRVVGMAEPSHGTSECYRFEHRLFQFLVEQMDFKAYVIEASASACESINKYILHGKGKLSKVLTGQGYSLWDTEEMSALIEWMRSYNRKVNDSEKVQFYGMDIGFNQTGRKKVRAYVKQFIPEWQAKLDPIFEQMAAADPKMPMRMNEFKEDAARLLPDLQAFAGYLKINRKRLVAASSVEAFEKIQRYTRIMEQFLAFHNNYLLRFEFMPENLLELVEKMPNTKFFVAAHKLHTGIGTEEKPNLGYLLRKELGNAYYAFCFDFNQGAFLTRAWDADQLGMGDFKVVEHPPVAKGTLPWYLAQANKDDFFLNLRNHDPNPAIRKWLTTPLKTYAVFWGSHVEKYLIEAKLELYDGIIFMKRSTASHPTKNSLKLIPKREGL